MQDFICTTYIMDIISKYVVQITMLDIKIIILIFRNVDDRSLFKYPTTGNCCF